MLQKKTLPLIEAQLGKPPEIVESDHHTKLPELVCPNCQSDNLEFVSINWVSIPSIYEKAFSKLVMEEARGPPVITGGDPVRLSGGNRQQKKSLFNRPKDLGVKSEAMS